MLNKIIIACAVLLTVGCTTTPQKHRDRPEAVMTVANYSLSETEVGDTVTFREIDYNVQAHYTAASGRTCKKLLNLGTGNIQVACRAEDREWYVRDPLAGVSNTNIKVPVTEPVVLLSKPIEVAQTDVQPNTRIDTLQPNETLWRFSRRVTGKASNWQTIAKYNNIDDVRALTGGQKLNIPPELIINGAKR